MSIASAVWRFGTDGGWPLVWHHGGLICGLDAKVIDMAARQCGADIISLDRPGRMTPVKVCAADSMHETAPTMKHPRRYGQLGVSPFPTPPMTHSMTQKSLHGKGIHLAKLPAGRPTQSWSLRHCDVMTHRRRATPRRQTWKPKARAARAARRSRHCEQVSARRREGRFGADSVRKMIGRRRKTEKSEDTLRRDSPITKLCERFHLMQLAPFKCR